MWHNINLIILKLFNITNKWYKDREKVISVEEIEFDEFTDDEIEFQSEEIDLDE